jgi:hypothetical protein
MMRKDFFLSWAGRQRSKVGVRVAGGASRSSVQS